MKLTLLTPALAAILGLALASAPLPTHAQTSTTTTSATSTTAAAKTVHFRGTLSAIDTAGNTISVENKTDGTRTFSISSTVKITKDKKTAALADLVVGDKIHGSFTKDASGTLTATVLSATTPKATSAATTATPAAQ